MTKFQGSMKAFRTHTTQHSDTLFLQYYVITTHHNTIPIAVAGNFHYLARLDAMLRLSISKATPLYAFSCSSDGVPPKPLLTNA